MAINSDNRASGPLTTSQNRAILYLDVDGVLLRRRNSEIFDGFELAPGCLEFLEWATTRFECRWLTSRARIGWPNGVRRAFRAAGAPINGSRWAVLDLIEPGTWSLNKSEALDPHSDFWWIDDSPTPADRDWLRVHECELRLIEISTDVDPDALIRLMRLWG